MYQKILQQPLGFGEEIGSHARSILTALLNRDPSHRLGVNGADEIKRHPFFAKNIDFDKLLHKQIQPPFKPSVASPVVRTDFLSNVIKKTRDLMRTVVTGCVELRHCVYCGGAFGQRCRGLAALSDRPGSVRRYVLFYLTAFLLGPDDHTAGFSYDGTHMPVSPS